LSDINKIFYDIVNQEDWDFSVDSEDPTIKTHILADSEQFSGDYPIGTFIVPTPIPGVYIHLSLGFDIDEPGEY
jgi:hypothetical protein